MTPITFNIELTRLDSETSQWVYNLMESILCRLFTESEIEEIRNIKLRDIILNASDIQPNEIQENVFFHVEGDPCPQPAQLNASNMEPCVFLGGFDYFQVNIFFRNILKIYFSFSINE